MARQANGEIRVFVPQLGSVTVTATRGEAETGFKASSSDTATRSGAELLDVPQSVTVITAKVIETQQAMSVQDVLQNVAGVVTRQSAQGTPSYSIRGFTQTSALSNGVSNPFASSGSIASVERIEVLKGPQAILSGGDSLGGGVNIVTKKPTAESVRELGLQYGSHADATATFDLAGAVREDKRVSYRLIGEVARAEHSEAGFKGRETDYLLAQMRWKDEVTDLTFGISYDDQRQVIGRYTFALDGGVQPIPTHRLGDKDMGIQLRTKAVLYSLEHVFSPAATLVSRAQYTETDQDFNLWAARFPMSVADMRLMFGNSNNISGYKTLAGDHYLRLSFQTGPFDHAVSVGVNHSRTKQSIDSYENPGVPVLIYAQIPPALPRIERDPGTLWSVTHIETQQTGFFVQDLIRFGDWNALLGVRRTEYDLGPTSMMYPSLGVDTSTARGEITATTPSAGLVYNLSSNISLYASYTEGFLPQTGVRRCDGGVGLPPQESINKELGFKVNSRDGAFGLTAAAFQVEQSNRAEYDNLKNCATLRAGVQTRGFETEAAGRLFTGLNMIANYTYTSTKDLGKATLLAAAQPRHQGSIWMTWDFQREALRGLGVGLGISAYSEARVGSTAMSPMAPGGAQTDVSMSYERDDWSLRLGVKNVFDRDLYSYSASEMFVPLRSGRTLTATYHKNF